jgi:uncharacterized phage infection (PIP) family protein YhgE
MVTSATGNKIEELGGSFENIGAGLSIVGEGAATAGMALSTIPSIISAIGISMSTGPMIAIAAVIGLISVAVNSFKKYKENIEEAKQAIIDSAKESQEKAEANRELAKSLNETIEGYENGVNSRKDVEEASQDLIEQYGLESSEVLGLTSDYEKLTKAIKDARIEEEKENLAAQKNSARVNRDKARDKVRSLLGIS